MLTNEYKCVILFMKNFSLEEVMNNTNETRKPVASAQNTPTYETIFCNTCGTKIAKTAVACPHCGAPVAQNQQTQQPQIVINNSNNNVNSNTNNVGAVRGKAKDKWVAFFLCLFLGLFGAHKFYEGKTRLGVLYLCTGGLCGIGWIIDTIALLFKPNPYYV